LLAIVAQTHPPDYFFIGDDSADLQFDPQQLPFGWQDRVRWVHFGGISLVREPLATSLLTLAAQLKTAGVRISYDSMLQQMTALSDVHGFAAVRRGDSPSVGPTRIRFYLDGQLRAFIDLTGASLIGVDPLL